MSLIGLICSCAGGGLSTSMRLGTAGFEACLFTLADKITVEYKYLKMISEGFYFAAAMFLGGVYGIMTIAEIALYGPVLSFFIILYNKTLLKWLNIQDIRNELYRNSRRWKRKMEQEVLITAEAPEEEPLPQEKA